MSYQPKNVLDVLVRAALITPEKGMTIIPQGRTKSTPERITYSKLLQQAAVLSRLVREIPGVKSDTIVLLHLDNHNDNIVWLWAIIAAGLVPAISTPFTNDLEQRKKHLLHLRDVLHDPVVITRENLLSEFAVADGAFATVTIESLASKVHDGLPGTSDTLPSNSSPPLLEEGLSKPSESIFALMLTSGSTGHAKAVVLRHGQVVSALNGKSAYHQTTGDDVFLNWIGMDHVANLTEIHLHSMYLGAEQVHVHAVDVIAQPMLYLQLIERYAASYSFAPNFFLASVKKAVQGFTPTEKSPLPDLSSMRLLISGGEANPTALAASLSQTLSKLGAPEHLIRPGFGMTETCAGSIYNAECPTVDLKHGKEFTSLGKCIPCMRMRVTRTQAGGAGAVVLAANEVGNLEVTGANVFNEYFNNPEATASSFTDDGWFVTGDLACIDKGGNLHLVGREKETIIINGVKYYPHEIEAAIEDASITGVTPSFVAVFPHRPKNADSETVCVVYLPSYQQDDDAARLQTRGAIRNVVMKHCMTRPHKIIPLDKIFLPKTALGKLSRSKIRKAFESGTYEESISFDEQRIARVSNANMIQPSTPTEIALQEVFADVFDLSLAEFGIHSNIYDLGCSSLEIFRLKWRLQSTPSFPSIIPITKIISNPTIALLSVALDPRNIVNGTSKVPKSYDPVVVLRTGGTKTPLWLVHPGVGEVLVFLNLARHITDRPVYALRARGFDGEAFFGSLDEMAATYLAAIKRVQPRGPYAIAGYSFGGTVAFEMAKMLRSEPYGDEVPFLAVFDQPPHIKNRMRQGGWVDVLLTLARFFNLLPDVAAEDKVATRLNSMALISGGGEGEEERDELVDVLLAESSEEMLQEFGLDKKRLATWTSLALNSHVIARDYDPTGKVPLLEVFYGQPIAAVAASVEEWLEMKLSGWRAFVDDVQFHQVQGHHYTLIAPENVGSFSRALEARLEARGV